MFSREGPNTFTGALVFRSGRADETLKSGGISHLVEHLAIHPFEALPYAINGFVDDTRTVFHATGTPAEVATFLNGIASNLANLPVDRLEDEMRVLRVEAHNSRLPSPARCCALARARTDSSGTRSSDSTGCAAMTCATGRQSG